MSDRMGSIAAQDAYDVPLDQGTNVGWANRLGEILTTRPTYDETVQYKTASPLVQITEGDIGRATEAAMGASGGGLSTKGIKAYHSSPHDFDKFDLSKIGTGEGAQVYGHGLYFAENPAVSGQGGEYWKQLLAHPGLPEVQQFSGNRLSDHGFNMPRAAAAAQRDVDLLQDMLKLDKYSAFEKEHARNLLPRRQAELDELLRGRAGPRTYEVSIAADPAHMLDWDKALSGQSEAVRKAVIDAAKARPTNGPLSRAINQDLQAGNLALTGEQAYSGIGGLGQNRKVATQALAERGIPGIKYLDQGSRGRSSPYLVQKMLDEAKAGLATAPKDKIDWHTRNVDLHERMLKDALKPDSSNYVIFDPSLIRIDKKYVAPGAIGAGGMGALAAQDNYQQ